MSFCSERNGSFMANNYDSTSKASPCDEANDNCSSTTTSQLFLLCSCFGLMSIGSGGIRSSSLAFGADQLRRADNMGWQVGFIIPVALMFISALSFCLASPFYVKLKANSNLMVEMLQVAIAANRKERIKVSTESSNMLYHHQKGSSNLPSEKLRFLNKACIIIDPEKNLTTDGIVADPWTLCTVNQVEDLKTLLKVIPIWSTGMIIVIFQANIC
ncbi:unnamed protein product [Coffea canephora]|uniref:Uncharacterized protein n=1 Tax=Coffea canephora TaxID=49390 RepID=A0A068V6G3_COFCA|nr:unnamed protein product [Coffea canephora]